LCVSTCAIAPCVVWCRESAVVGCGQSGGAVDARRSTHAGKSCETSDVLNFFCDNLRPAPQDAPNLRRAQAATGAPRPVRRCVQSSLKVFATLIDHRSRESQTEEWRAQWAAEPQGQAQSGARGEEEDTWSEEGSTATGPCPSCPSTYTRTRRVRRRRRRRRGDRLGQRHG
jgi:hypothetical protein